MDSSPRKQYPRILEFCTTTIKYISKKDDLSKSAIMNIHENLEPRICLFIRKTTVHVAMSLKPNKIQLRECHATHFKNLILADSGKQIIIQDIIFLRSYKNCHTLCSLSCCSVILPPQQFHTSEYRFKCLSWILNPFNLLC